MKIQCFWLVKSICKHPISWLLRKIGCLATVAMLLRVSVGTTPENVKVDVKDICAKFHAFTTIRAFFAPIAQTNMAGSLFIEESFFLNPEFMFAKSLFINRK